MIRHIPVNTMYKARPASWLDTVHHFSFADYYDPNNMNFGVLRVVNDDLIAPNSGFDTHYHNDMEIVTYMISGALTHKDSIGNTGTIRRGEVQYMSAGRGILHSEMNGGSDTVRLLQIWILPEKRGLPPAYGEHKFDWDERRNKPLHLVSKTGGPATIGLNQDVNIYAVELEDGMTLDFPIGNGRQSYIIQAEGSSDMNGIIVNERDALTTVEENLRITAKGKSHILFIEMAKGM